MPDDRQEGPYLPGRAFERTSPSSSAQAGAGGRGGFSQPEMLTRDQAGKAYNDFARKLYEQSKSAGEPFDSPKNRARLDSFKDSLTRRIQTQPTGPKHMTREGYGKMRAETKGAEFPTEQDMRNFTRQVRKGHYARHGESWSPRRVVGRLGGKAAVRFGGPVAAAGYAGYKLGGLVPTGARKRNAARKERSERFESYQDSLRQVFEDRDEGFYRSMAIQMVQEDEDGYTDPDPAGTESKFLGKSPAEVEYEEFLDAMQARELLKTEMGYETPIEASPFKPIDNRLDSERGVYGPGETPPGFTRRGVRYK